MVNVRWVDEFEKDINEEEFLKDYLEDTILVKDMLVKYGLSQNEFNHVRDRLTDFRREKGIKRPKYYHYDKKNGTYIVQKLINKKPIYFGRYKTKEEALKVINFLKENNWKRDGFEEFKEANNIYNVKRWENYFRSNGKYVVRKMIDKKSIYYGAYPSERIAQMIVHELREVEWDKSQLPLIKEKLKDNGLIS